MMKESAAPAVNQQLIAMLRQQPAFIDAIFAAISGNPSILSLVARNIKDPGMKQMLNRAMGLSKKKNKAPMGQPTAPAAPMGQPAGMAQPMGQPAAPMAQPAGVMAPRASSKIQVNKYASGYYNTPSLPGQMFWNKDSLIKAAQGRQYEDRKPQLQKALNSLYDNVGFMIDNFSKAGKPVDPQYILNMTTKEAQFPFTDQEKQQILNNITQQIQKTQAYYKANPPQAAGQGQPVAPMAQPRF